MTSKVPDSFFSSAAKQDTTEEKAERSEAQLYLSQNSDEEVSYVEGAKPGIALDLMPVPEHLRKIYGKFSDDPETRKKEIETLLMVDFSAPLEEDRKCSPVPSCSSSDSEVEVPVPKKPKLNLKMSEKTKTVRRVKRNVEHGLHNEYKKPKKAEQLWNYVEQKLVKTLVIQVLPLPPTKSTFLKPNKMTMEKVVDPSLESVLLKFNPLMSVQIKLSDIQTESMGSLRFRRVVVRKRLGAGKYTFAVMPNMVINSDRKVFHLAPDGVWYEKTTTNNRSKEMAIPKPFQGNQSMDVLFDNTFAWDV